MLNANMQLMAVTGPVNRAKLITAHSARLNTHTCTQTAKIPYATSHKPEASSMLRTRKKRNNPKEEVVQFCLG